MPLQPANKTRSFLLDKLSPLIIVLVFGGVVIPVYIYVIQPKILEYLPGSARHIDTQIMLVKARSAYLKDLRAFHDLYTAKGMETDSPISTLVPEGRKTHELFGLFESAGQEFGANLQAIDITVPADAKGSKEGIEELSINLKYAGLDYKTLKGLLTYFETLQRLTDVTAFSFDPIGRFASITARVYSLSEKKQ